MPITAKDVAKLADVSPATVSRVFNQQAHVSEQIRKHVMQCAQQLNYAPKSSTRNSIIALLLPDCQRHPYQGYIWSCTSALVREICNAGFNVELIPTNVIHLLDQPNICGIISLVYDQQDWQNWDNPRNLPLVNINAKTPDFPNALTVASNSAQGLALAINHLLQNGHEKIGLFTKGIKETYIIKELHRHFAQVGVDAGLPRNQLLIQHGVHKSDHYEAIGKLVRQQVTAIICPGEDSGLIAAYILNLFNCPIPSNMSLISHEIIQTSEYYLPQHTTLKQDFDGIATTAINLMQKMIDHDRSASDILVDFELIERESVLNRCL